MQYYLENYFQSHGNIFTHKKKTDKNEIRTHDLEIDYWNQSALTDCASRHFQTLTYQ